MYPCFHTLGTIMIESSELPQGLAILECFRCCVTYQIPGVHMHKYATRFDSVVEAL